MQNFGAHSSGFDKENNDAAQWDRYATLYDTNMGNKGDPFHQELIDPSLLHAMGDVEGKVVIDGGCGNGHLTFQIAQRGTKRVVGIDQSRRMIELAKMRFSAPNLTFEVADLTQVLNWEENEVDCIVVNMVLQYLNDLSSFLREAHRVLKTGGSIVASIDHPSHSLFMRALQLAGTDNPKFRNDIHYFERAYCLKTSLWGQATLGYYHRPLQDYLQVFLDIGFALSLFQELGRGIQIGAEHEVIPRVVVLRYLKVTC